jgi:hypothetical protein
MLSPQEIFDTVKKIHQEVKESKVSPDETKKNVQDKYREFSLNYPAIFIMAADGNLDLDRFKSMVDMAQKVKNDEITQHDASVKVGEQLVDHYVKPKIKNLKKKR